MPWLSQHAVAKYRRNCHWALPAMLALKYEQKDFMPSTINNPQFRPLRLIECNEPAPVQTNQFGLPMNLHRRGLLNGALGLIVLGRAAPCGAATLTGIAALDTAAIAVKYPARALLVAITRTPSNRLVAAGEHGVVIFSDDDGVSWTQASVPVNVTLTCLGFATGRLGWAAGHYGVILNTQDGGQTWQEQLNGVQANALTEAAAEDPSIETNPSPGAPLAARRAAHFLASGPDNPFLTLLVQSPQKIIVFGAYRMTMLSNDGGRTWQDWSLHIYDKFSHNIYDAMADGGTIYLVAEEGLMFSSNDGGNTFLPLNSPGATTIFGILAARDGSLLVYGVAGFAARSTDKGNSWTQLNIASQQDLTAGRVLESGSIVVVDEAGLLFESADNGVTFTSVQGVQPQPFFDVQQAADGRLIAVGAAGVTQISKSLLTS
jgi:photosystem II stability/assembly factor-like uncharacterized protein